MTVPRAHTLSKGWERERCERNACIEVAVEDGQCDLKRSKIKKESESFFLSSYALPLPSCVFLFFNWEKNKLRIAYDYSHDAHHKIFNLFVLLLCLVRVHIYMNKHMHQICSFFPPSIPHQIEGPKEKKHKSMVDGLCVYARAPCGDVQCGCVCTHPHCSQPQAHTRTHTKSHTHCFYLKLFTGSLIATIYIYIYIYKG